MATESTSASSLQEEVSIVEFINGVATETLALFEHLEFDFLSEFDAVAPARRGRTRDRQPPELFRAVLHYYYMEIYGIRPVTRELQNTVVWLSWLFDRPPSRDAVDRFLTDLEHVVDENSVIKYPYSSAVRVRAWHRQFREITLAAAVYNVEQAVKQ